MPVKDRPVTRSSGRPVSAEGREPPLCELGNRLLRLAVVDPIAPGEVSLNRCPELDRVDLALERLLALPAVDAVPHVVTHAGLHLALVDARHHTSLVGPPKSV